MREQKTKEHYSQKLKERDKHRHERLHYTMKNERAHKENNSLRLYKQTKSRKQGN